MSSAPAGADAEAQQSKTTTPTGHDALLAHLTADILPSIAIPPSAGASPPPVTLPDNTENSYSQALSLLASLQTNAQAIQLVAANADMNLTSIPEMMEWIKRMGYNGIEDWDGMRVIHVAGTKGKGSTAAMIEAALRCVADAADGMEDQELAEQVKRGIGKVGLYTSPHLIDVRERIKISGIPISESLFTQYLTEIWQRLGDRAAAEGHTDPAGPGTKPGFFRFLTLLAMHAFRSLGVRTAVIEVGIGGAYDCTNVWTAKQVSVDVITRLGIDHVGMLGETIEQIAWHKAGIMRDGVKCVSSPQVPEARKVIEQRAEELGARLVEMDDIPLDTKEFQRFSFPQNVSKEEWDDLVREGLVPPARLSTLPIPTPLKGIHQQENARLALSAVVLHLQDLGIPINHPEILGALVNGIKSVRLPGRGDVSVDSQGVKWVLDGAHTTDSLNQAVSLFKHECTADAGLHSPDKREREQATKQVQILVFNSPLRDASVLAQHLAGCLDHASLPDGFNDRVGRKLCPVVLVVGGATYMRDVPAQPDLGMQHRAAAVFETSGRTAKVIPSIEEALLTIAEMQRRLAAGEEDAEVKVLVTGSLHLVGAVLRIQGRGLEQGPEK
jgi:folylpolyglutamate synthase